jgi:probable rRNA maturation factor
MSEPAIDIVLQNPNRYPEAGARHLRPWLKRLAASLVERELPSVGGASLGVRFASDRELRRVNRDYRGKDKPTDVLSFPGEPAGEELEEGRHVGDILISVPTARRQAAERGHSPELEIKTLLLHGLLHCLGYDHEADRGQMERLERRLRRTWIGDSERGHG